MCLQPALKSTALRLALSRSLGGTTQIAIVLRGNARSVPWSLENPDTYMA